MVLVAAGLTIFFNLRGTPIVQSIALAASAVLIFVGLLTIPLAIREFIRNQRLLHAAVVAHTLEQSP